MAKTQKFAIISKLKTLVKKTGHTIFRPSSEPSIPEDVARKIQTIAYEISKEKRNDSYTPPYLAIAEQLQVADSQIFRAAASTLTAIALNEPKQAGEILAAIKKNVFSDRLSKDQAEYIKSKIALIKEKTGG